MGIKLRRKLYTRGSSYETTIPSPLLFKLDLNQKKYFVIFQHNNSKEKWYIQFEENTETRSKATPSEFSRKLYTRGSSYETTIPMPLLFKLSLPEKKYNVLFVYEEAQDTWSIDFTPEAKKKKKEEATNEKKLQ